MRVLLRRRCLLIILVMIIALAATNAIVFAAARTKITVFTYPSGGRPDWFAAGAKAFMALNPDIEVEVQNGWYSQLTVWAAGGVYPDVMHYDAQYLSQMAVNGLVMPLDDLVAKDLNTAPYIPILFDNLKYRGKLYGVPHDFDVIALRYNRDIYQSRGMPDIKKAWSWDELVSNSKKLTYDTNGDGIIDVYGFMDHWGNSLSTPTWVWMAGGEIWNEDHTDTYVDSPEVIAGYKMQYDIRFTYNIAPRADDPAYKSGNPMNHFPQGQIATMMNGKGVTSSAALKFDNAVGPLMIGPSGKPVSGMMEGFLGISPHSADKEAAWRLVKFLCSREGFQAGREDLREMEVYSMLSPITAQILEQIKEEGEPGGGEWWLAMAQVARITDGKHPTGTFSIAKPNWNDIIAGQSVHDDCHEIAADVRNRIQELITQGYKW